MAHSYSTQGLPKSGNFKLYSNSNRGTISQKNGLNSGDDSDYYSSVFKVSQINISDLLQKEPPSKNYLSPLKKTIMKNRDIQKGNETTKS